MAVSTEPDPRSPAPQRHPGAYVPGAAGDRGAEYGAPAAPAGIVSFGPQHHPGRAGDAGRDEHPPSLGDIVGPAPAIGEIRR